MVVLRYTLRFTQQRKAGITRRRERKTLIHWITFDIVSAYPRILEAIMKGDVAYAVFVVSGKARIAAINSDLFRQASKMMPERMIGIYDQSVDPEWLMQDLRNAESEAHNEYNQSL